MRLIFLFFISILASTLQAQLTGNPEDESKFYAETKQVNQFFRRFNGEEDEKGERYYPKDKQYRSVKLRKKYLPLLFDASNPNLSAGLAAQFGKDILEGEKPFILNFHGGNWFAEVQTNFTSAGKEYPVTLFMELEKHHQGSRWVITKAYSQFFDPYFSRDTVKLGQFLHPLSHELAFVNMRRAFSKPDSVGHYVSKQFRPDHLTMLMYEMRKGNLRFQTVSEVKFHFFQAPGWYFELSEFNRSGYNTGWLISNLVKLNSDKERELLRKHLYYE
jgi:hypothetical protein